MRDNKSDMLMHCYKFQRLRKHTPTHLPVYRGLISDLGAQTGTVIKCLVLQHQWPGDVTANPSEPRQQAVAQGAPGIHQRSDDDR